MTGMTRGKIDGWGLYLFLLVCLIPVVVPNGPARTAIVDALIVLGLGAFAVSVVTKREPVQVPFLAPVLMMSVGSMLAVINAESPAASFVTMAQDAYLYLWFIMLVHLLRQRDLKGIGVTWVWVANVVALLGIVLVMREGHLSLLDLIKPTGKRAYGTFYNPNIFASYLVMSLFIVLSLGPQIGRMMRWGSISLLAAALMATKSNGGMLSLVAGLAVWALVRARTQRLSPVGLAAGALIVVSVALAGLWITTGLGVGSSQLRALQTHSILARASHSSESRFKIWQLLQRTYAKSPLGIGPGNSRWLTVSVEDRMRPNSLQAKEAHNDYLAYAIERGPLALLGLLALQAQAFGKLAAAWRRRGSPRAHGRSLDSLVAAATGALVAASIHALTSEVLHFRHFWMLLAIVCAIEGAPARGRVEAPRPLDDVIEPPSRRVATAGA